MRSSATVLYGIVLSSRIAHRLVLVEGCRVGIGGKGDHARMIGPRVIEFVFLRCLYTQIDFGMLRRNQHSNVLVS